MCITVPAACVSQHSGIGKRGKKSVFDFPALSRMEEDALDHVKVNIVGLHVLDGAKRTEALLHLDSAFDDLAAETVGTLRLELLGFHGSPLSGELNLSQY
jgi:hypothetical protein